ncbi:MAG: acyltransferase domain-containing protein [bacterium]
MNIKEFALNINFPEELMIQIDSIIKNDLTDVKKCFDKFIQGDNDSCDELNKVYNDEKNVHLVWLYLYFNECLNTYNKYKQLGIDDKVFFDTMGIFTRSVLENKNRTGEYYFNIQWWTQRQVNMILFRLGMLEYEFQTSVDDIVINNEVAVKAGDKLLSVHIPSDVSLTKEGIEESYLLARNFMNKYFKEYNNAYFVCSTWLLSVDLENLLPNNSKLKYFRDDYTIFNSEDNNSYKLWLFGNEKLEVKDYPENTSLQRNVKKHLLNGGMLRNSIGIILK